MWWKSNTPGASIYRKFTVVNVLSANMRINSANPQASRFQEILDHIYDGAVTEDDVREIRETCSKPTIEARKHGEWKRRGFDDMATTHMYPRNADVRRRNHEVLTASKSKIALIESENSCAAARRMKADDFMQLELHLFLAVGATVMCTSNSSPLDGLCNGAVGKVMDMVWSEGSAPPSLPCAVYVDFPGYTGPPAFPGSVERKGWVPIVPRKVHVGDRWRNQLPLKLSSAWTPFKVQGETIRPPRLVFADLGKTERWPGSTYTIFSRLTELRQLGLNGVTSERLMKGISNGKSFQARKKEIERLKTLGAETRERWQPHFADEDAMSIDGDGE